MLSPDSPDGFECPFIRTAECADDMQQCAEQRFAQATLPHAATQFGLLGFDKGIVQRRVARARPRPFRSNAEHRLKNG
jgi:hypothetical protein